jgi:hypothetical protein
MLKFVAHFILFLNNYLFCIFFITHKRKKKQQHRFKKKKQQPTIKKIIVFCGDFVRSGGAAGDEGAESGSGQRSH